MSARSRHEHRDEPELVIGELGLEEFYDDDDLEELDEGAPAAELEAFDSAAMGEDAERELAQSRTRAGRGGADDPHTQGGQRLQKVLAHAGVASRRAS